MAVDYRAMPPVAFTDPELASVSTLNNKLRCSLQEISFLNLLSGNGRALSLNATEGFVRLITTKEDNVVGAQVAGVNASNIIAELGL